jgi:hypothetical protein
MSAPLLGRHFAELQSASTPTIAVAAVGSFAGQVAAVVEAAPLWVYVVAAVAPWIPILVLELVWTYRHYRWLAVFCLLIVTQSTYLLEQVARMMQVHVLGHEVVDAAGIFGTLDVGRVHLVWTSWAVLGVVLLVTRFPRNPWLWVTLAVIGIDAIGWSMMPLAVDLQFVYSVVEIAALNVAFALQLGRTYDAWLARAFPQLPERVLIDTTGHMDEVRLRPGERVAHDPDRLYIVTRGRGVLVREGPGGHDILIGVLAPGQIVRESGTLLAETVLELLALPASAL